MDGSGEVLTVVEEIPKGSRNTYEFDHESGTIFLDRSVFVEEPTFPGCQIHARPVRRDAP